LRRDSCNIDVEDELAEKGRDHNPTRQRGILGHATEQPKINPSLTFWVSIRLRSGASGQSLANLALQF